MELKELSSILQQNGIVGAGGAGFPTYAKLNENAAIGAEGNPNEVYLEFSNDPYGTGTGETEKDKVK